MVTINSLAQTLNPQGKLTNAAKDLNGQLVHPSVKASESHDLKSDNDRSHISPQAQFAAAYDELKSAVTELENARNSKKVSVSGTDSVATGSALASAIESSFKVTVTNLASAQTLQSDTIDDIEKDLGNGELTLGTSSGSLKITITGGLKNVADQINSAEGNQYVTASIVTEEDGARLVLRAKDTGADSAFTVAFAAENQSGQVSGLAFLSFASAGTGGLSRTSEASDAVISIDSRKIISASNNIDDTHSGLSLSIAAEETATFTVSQDSTRFDEAKKNFAAAYERFSEKVAKLDDGQGGPSKLLAKLDNLFSQRDSLDSVTIKQLDEEARKAGVKLDASIPDRTGVKLYDELKKLFDLNGTDSRNNLTQQLVQSLGEQTEQNGNAFGQQKQSEGLIAQNKFGFDSNNSDSRALEQNKKFEQFKNALKGLE